MSRYKEIVGPNKRELDEIERIFNPDKLKSEDLFAEISEDAFYEDEFLDTSRTEGGNRKKKSQPQKANKPQNLKNVSKEILKNTEIENLDLSARQYNVLKRAGLKTVDDVIIYIENGTSGTKNLGIKSLEEVITKLDSLGLAVKKECNRCHAILLYNDFKFGYKFCRKCREEVEQSLATRDIAISVLSPTPSLNTKEQDVFYIDIDIKNNTSDIVKIELKDAVIIKDEIQYVSECDFTECGLSEECILPHSTRKFTKKWKTSDWANAELCDNDRLIILLKGINSGKLYFFKYNKTPDGWSFYDYSEIN
ncbi:MAG: hypothetical protein J6D15_02800 [Clostridia bacterium]|nr:hypothetical protein [Clostridia bacterium]